MLSTVQPVDEQGHYDTSHGLRGGIQQELHFCYKSSAARARRKKRGFSLCLGADVRSRVRQSGFSRLQRNAAPGITSFRRAAPPCLYLKSDALSPGVFPIRRDLTRRRGSLMKKKERRVISAHPPPCANPAPHPNLLRVQVSAAPVVFAELPGPNLFQYV